MKVIKKINNNAAVCTDSQGKEIVAFGKGIGFPKAPYELTDLSKVSMTFYRLNSHYFELLNEIPEDVFEVSAEIVDLAKRRIKHVINPNLVFTLADHINFALERLRDYQGMKFPFSYDIKQLYPQETAVAELALTIIDQKFQVTMPSDEITAIAMHLVNSRALDEAPISVDPTEKVINQTIKIIEQTFDIKVDEGSFTYNRFAMHMRYYIKRLKGQAPSNPDDVSGLVATMRKDDAKAYTCAEQIADFVDRELGEQSSEDEVFYVAIYVRRMANHNQI